MQLEATQFYASDVKPAYGVQEYAADVKVAYGRAGVTGWLVAGMWCLCPFVVQSIRHPEDIIRLQYIVQGQPAPPAFTAQQLAVGVVETALILGVLILCQLVCTILFYRRSKLQGAKKPATPMLWPLAVIVPGLIGNGIWYFALGYWDQTGFLIGLVPMVLTFGAELICNRLGRNFVYGEP